MRLYVLSNLAGALEPCGCTQDQLGGMDRLAAFMTKERTAAPASAFVAAGPMLFMEPRLDPSRQAQDVWKAETISTSLRDLGLIGWAPGANDFAAGTPELETFLATSGAKLLAGNLEGAGAVSTVLREVGGVKVGFVGVSLPVFDASTPIGVEIKDDASAAFERGTAKLREEGAQILVGAAAMPRGQALRLLDVAPTLNALVVGKPFEEGDANDGPPPPMLVGNTVVLQTSNHLQTVGVLDFFVQGENFDFADGSGIANLDALASLDRRILDLETRIAAWERGGTVTASDLSARRSDLGRLRDERAALASPKSPPEGSHFRFRLEEVRQAHGRDDAVFERMLSFYKKVNEHNRIAFANEAPPPVPKGESGYVGIEACSACHVLARKVWDGTAHARAYQTLVSQHKEFNLDCVSCHVTGYGQPGGSTVTMNASLQNVQCEQCHGPGEAHAKQPGVAGLITRDPSSESCVSACHHPPHVDGFDPVKARLRILGPGHGMPLP